MVDFYRRNDDAALSSIPLKANKLLYILLTILALIVLRIWYLSCVQHEKRSDEAFRPRRKVIIEPAERGTIRDRFNIVLAANKVEYRLAIVYSQIRDVPVVAFEKTADGSKKKRYLRKEYIKALATMIAGHTALEADRIEDSIYSHAALYDTIPYVIKQSLSEREYYRLKILEKDYPGLLVERVPKRYYPKGAVGAHLIGYLGPMQKERYDKLVKDIRLLSDYIKNVELGLEVDLPESVTSFYDAKRKLYEQQVRAYTINDDVGSIGVEASYESELRGYFGKKVYFSDAKGNFVRPMPGSHTPLSGKRLLLSLSVELQEFSEKLLAQSEKDRELSHEREVKIHKGPAKEPWMRGGAIVALDPKTGEILTMASYPRFNPNDFSRQRKKEAEIDALRWIENDAYIACVWDQSLPLVRELVGKDKSSGDYYNDEKWLSWQTFLEMLLPPSSALFEKLHEEKPILDLVVLQRAFDEILRRAPAHSPIEALKLLENESKESDVQLFQGDIASLKAICKNAFQGLENAQEKLLLLDLSRLILNHEDFTADLIQKIGSFSIKDFRDYSSAAVQAFDVIRKNVRQLFHEQDFKEWRRLHEKEFLQAARQKEKQKKELARPFLDYLNRREKALFETFWKRWRATFLEFYFTGRYPDEKNLQIYFDKFSTTVSLPKEKKLQTILQTLEPELVPLFLTSLKGFSDLKQPLYGSYRGVNGKKTKDLARTFVSVASSGYLRSYAFRQTTIQGSVFKLVTAYSGLKQRYLECQGNCTQADLALFEITDHTSKFDGRTFLGAFKDGKAIPQLYKGGRLPKSLNSNLGKMDLLKAIETSSNPYFSLLAGDFLHDPDDLLKAARDFGYGQKSDLDIPGEIPGNIPSDLQENRTGLYATAIGQHTLITTPLQTALMLSSIANGGKLLQPKIVSLIVGKSHDFDGVDLTSKATDFAHKQSLKAVGIDFPLFLQGENRASCEVKKLVQNVKKEIFLPELIRQTLLEGMRRSVQHAQEERYGALSRLYQAHPEMQKDFLSLKGELVGKTSTAEVIEKVGLDVVAPSHMYRHIWFGGISFNKKKNSNYSFVFKDAYGEPELVVVVYLRFGGYGKEAAPMAAQVVQKWRQINDLHAHQ